MEQRSLLIDEIKGLAILSVIVFHLGYFKYGYLGVDVFLAIAGYLTAAGWSRKEDFSLFGFLFKRIQRLWPMVAGACLVSLLFGYWTMLPDDYENLAQSIIASLSFSNNILCRISSGDYWAQSNDYKPLLHFWYLGVLMQLYFGFAVLAACVQRKMNRIKWLSWIVLIASIVSAVIWFGKVGDQAVRFYYMPWRFFEFGFGVLLFCWGLRIPKNLTFRIPGLAALGRMSLSVYVWHYIILAFYRYVVTPQLSWTFLALYGLALGALSWITYRTIEQSRAWIVTSAKGLWLVIFPMVALIGSLAMRVVFISGIVRDVPELDIVRGGAMRGIHSLYNERVRKLPRTFADNGRKNVLVVGNSWGRDWCNVLMESGVTNEINLAYYSQNEYEQPLRNDVINAANVIFLVGVYENRLPDSIKPNGIKAPKIVGRKWFGYSCGNFYNRRWFSGYYEQTIQLPINVVAENQEQVNRYGSRYVDMIGCVAAENNGNLYMPIFSDERKIISQDCQHLTRGGACYYASRLPIRRIVGLDN